MKSITRTLVALLALALPLSGEAQQPRKMPRIGVLVLTSTSSAGAIGLGLRAALRDAGYVDGQTVRIDYVSAEGHADRLPQLAAQLVERKPDVIITGGGNVSTLAAKNATKTIPIVMTGTWRAVESGFIESLARPGGNITGVTVPRELALKQMELMREIVPSFSRMVVFTRNSLETPAQRADSIARVHQFFGITLDVLNVEEPDQLGRALEAARALRPHAVMVGPDPLFFDYHDRFVQFARSARVPAMYPFRHFVDAGGLVSYSLSPQEIVRHTARYVDLILKGARPADLPVEEPTIYELVINLRTAKALGLTIPQSVLLRASDVLQ